MTSRFAPILAAALLSAGCYMYQPTRLESVSPGDAVRLRLSPEEADRLIDIRQTDSRLVDGVLVGNGGEGVLLETTIGMNDPRRGTRVLRQRIAIPAAEVREVELRRIDRLKTGLVVGGVALGVGAIVAAAFESFGANDNTDPPSTEELVVPVRFGFRLPIPIF